ncbi:hypothetical protein HPB49_020914 [Dermacentor silvarum]|uniref:Uncharacterized protein n=1 Tax=Dermacentor silvarum TaxID=543639 RepID=A0ACB8DFP9_DERSI|nr:hypothetical protein HPB49_020914 [Dermacentor silvarum]
MDATPGNRLTLSAIAPRSTAATTATQSPLLWEIQVPYGHGAFQLLNVFSAVVAMGNYLLHSEIFLLTAGVMDHWCKRPDSFANLSVDEWKQLAIPIDEHGQYSHCNVRDPPDGGDEARVVPCASWEYDFSLYGDNIVSHWNLVCDRHWLIGVARSVYAAASVVPLAAATLCADSIGRRTALFITIPVVLISAVASAMPNDLHFFMAVRAVVSASTSALVPPAIALVVEASPIEKLAAHIVAISLLSFVLMPVTMFAAQLASSGWVAVQLILMVPTCLLVALYYTVNESPSWLLVTGNFKEAERVALRAAYMNGVNVEVCQELIAHQIANVKASGCEAPESSGLCCARLRVRTILVCGMWAALCYGFDTFITKDGIPVGDVATSLSFVLSAVACVAAVPFVASYGFRNTVVGSGLGFALTLTTLVATYTKGALLRDSLVVLMRVAGNVCFTFFIAMSIKSYPIETHCRGAAAILASSRFGDTLGQMSPVLMGDHCTTLQLATAAVLMSLFVVGAEFLPSDADIWLRHHLARGSSFGSPSSEGTKRAMFDTLVPLPKGPVQRRATKMKDRAALSANTSQATREK